MYSHSNMQAKVLHCFLLNGCVFLGSLAWWVLALQPLVHWLIELHVVPVVGNAAAANLEALLHGLYHVCWLVPVYLVTLMVSCSWWGSLKFLINLFRGPLIYSTPHCSFRLTTVAHNLVWFRGNQPTRFALGWQSPWLFD
jgi:hypothetical protein